MSVSTIACAFVSFRSSFFGVGCKNDATHRYNDMDLCRAHWLYESGAFPVCGLCKNSRYEDTWVIQDEHTCIEGDRGWDCMHFEGVSYCDCESESQVAFESATREPVVLAECRDCEYENEADTVRYGVPICYECMRDIESSDAYYKDMMDASGQY